MDDVDQVLGAARAQLEELEAAVQLARLLLRLADRRGVRGRDRDNVAAVLPIYEGMRRDLASIIEQAEAASLDPAGMEAFRAAAERFEAEMKRGAELAQQLGGNP